MIVAVQLQLHACQALHLELLLLSIKLQNDKDGAGLDCAVMPHSLCVHRHCRSKPVCTYVPVSAGVAVKWVSNLGSWRCSMCNQVHDHQIITSSPFCTRLTRHRPKRPNNLKTCRDSALFSKCFVVRRLLKTCLVATAENTHSLEQITNIFQLARLQPSELPTSVSSIFSFALGTADCHVTPQLIQKFGEDKRRWQESRKGCM